MSWADDIDSAEGSKGGAWVLPGVYKVRITKCSGRDKNRKGFPQFVAEMDILESNNPERPAGGKMAWICVFKPDTPALGNVRTFISIIEQAPLEQVTKQVGEFYTSAAQPAAGAIMKLVAYNIKTKKDADFTVVEWELVESPPGAEAAG